MKKEQQLVTELHTDGLSWQRGYHKLTRLNHRTNARYCN